MCVYLQKDIFTEDNEMKKRMMILAVLLTLCGCAETNNQIEETDSIPDEIVTFYETVPTVTQAPELSWEDTYLRIEINDDDPNSEAPDLSRAKTVQILNCGDAGLDFLAGTNIESLQLFGFTGRISDYIDIFSRMPELKLVEIETPEFSHEESELLMMSDTQTEFIYEFDWYDDNNFFAPDSGFEFYIIEPFVNVYYNSFMNRDKLEFRFSNFTDEPKTVNGLKIYRDNSGEWEQCAFTDESYFLPLDIEVPANAFSEQEWHSEQGGTKWELTAEQFDFYSAAPGIYKAVADMDGEDKEMEFLIGNLTLDNFAGSGYEFDHAADEFDFFDEEQKEAFNNALRAINLMCGWNGDIMTEYASSHTADDLFNDCCVGLMPDYAYSKAIERGIIDEDGQLAEAFGDRGSYLTYLGEYFVPVYMTRDSALIKNVSVNWFSDYPYNVWYSVYNYHMVKTEDGWKFDVFQIWY